MSTPKAEVRLSATFEGNLEDIETFLLEAGASTTYHALLDGLLNHVIPNLEDFPVMGVPFIGRKVYSVEVKRALEALHDKIPQGIEVRSYSWSDYLMLYSWDGKAVNLLSIKHHRQLSFDLNSVWK